MWVLWGGQGQGRCPLCRRHHHFVSFTPHFFPCEARLLQVCGACWSRFPAEEPAQPASPSCLYRRFLGSIPRGGSPRQGLPAATPNPLQLSTASGHHDALQRRRHREAVAWEKDARHPQVLACEGPSSQQLVPGPTRSGLRRQCVHS